MTNRRLALAATLLLAWSLGLAAPASPKAKSKTADEADRIARIEAGLLPRVLVEGTLAPELRLSDRMGHYRVPGLSIAVVDGGQLKWTRGYGFADVSAARQVMPETRFQVGELSTLVTAIGAMALVDQHKLELDVDIARWLRSWRVPPNALTAEKKVTLRRLLSHSAGFDVDAFEGYESSGDVPTLLQVLDGKPPATNPPLGVEYLPGTRTQYSAGGYAVLQQLMVDATRTPFAALMNRLVLGPAGMKASSFEQPPPSKLGKLLATGHTPDGPVEGGWRVYPEAAAAGLWTTAGDLARLTVALQQAAAGHSKLLGRERAEELLTPGFTEMALGPRVFGSGEARRFTLVGQSAGFEAVLVGYVGTGRGAVVLTNGEGGYALAHELLLAVAKEYGWPDYAPRPAKRLAPELLDSLAGKYRFEAITLGGRELPALDAEAYVEGGQLYWVPAGLPPRPLYAEDKDRFFALDGAPGVSFERDPKGRAVAAVVKGGGVERKAKRL